tara:strand:- start:4337 stop:4474 length:138 start_codon:yes stop_codon:yes gene_type:complete
VAALLKNFSEEELEKYRHFQKLCEKDRNIFYEKMGGSLPPGHPND